MEFASDAREGAASLDYYEDEASFRDYREKELEHVCLAMMGALGMRKQSLVQVGAAVRDAGRQHRAARKVRNSNRKPQLGAQDPLGLWDPLGYREDEAFCRKYREKELEPGRLLMMDALSRLTQSLVRMPGMCTCP